jgi:hypothetical protein
MVTRYKKFLCLEFLLIFLFLILFINFFHTEKTGQSNHFCPACHFQNSTLAIDQINFFHPPQLYFLEVLKAIESYHYSQNCFLNPTSRSPPQI